MLGADARGQRLNRLHRENIDESIFCKRWILCSRVTPPNAAMLRVSVIFYCVAAWSPP